MEDGGLWCELFGVTPYNRILEEILIGSDIDLTIQALVSSTDLTKPTVYKIIKQLVKEKIVKPTRSIAGAQLYALNKDNEKAGFLLKTFNDLLEQEIKKHSKRPILVEV